jgi:O-antigen/teichoic acid export membrane protein
MINPFPIDKIKQLLRHKLVRQTSLLFSSDFLATLLAILTGILNTRVLGKAGYGDTAFVYAVLNISGLIFNFGIFNAGSRCLARVGANLQKEREIVGTLLLATFFLLIGYAALIFSFSFYLDAIFDSHVNQIFKYIFIFAAAYPLEQLLDQLCQGTNQIRRMAFFKIFPRAAYLIAAFGLIRFSELTLLRAILLNLGFIFLAATITLARFRPSFNHFQANLHEIIGETRSYGFHVYLGRISSLATYDSTKLLISYFGNNTTTGFYNLAMLLTSPMIMLSRALSISLFKDFLPKRNVPEQVTKFNLGWLIFGSSFLMLFGRFIIRLLYGTEFLPAYPLLLILALATLFRGLIQPYNLFLGAKGCGRQLRNTAFILAAAILLCNLALIPFFGATGAALASLAALGLNYFVHLFYYRKFVSIQ